MKSLTYISLLLVLVCCPACGTVQTAPLPTVPPATRIILTPSTAYWSQAIHDCSQFIPEVSIVTDIVQQKNLMAGESDWVIRSGEPLEANAYSLGEDHLTVIVHPDNPLVSLRTDQLAGIFTGFIQTWDGIQSDLPGDQANQPIKPYTYFEGDDLGMVFQASLMKDELIGLQVATAPEPVEVIQSVMKNATAIGYIPQKWVTSSVKKVSLDEEIPFPVTLSMKSTPNESQQRFIACLQKK
jgi:DNA-binding transcriptional LysR family regulator